MLIKSARSLVIFPLSTVSIHTRSKVFANSATLGVLSSLARCANPCVQAKIDAKGDHRIAMSFYVLSQVLNKSFKIKDFNYVKTSFPSFTKTINQLKKN